MVQSPLVGAQRLGTQVKTRSGRAGSSRGCRGLASVVGMTGVDRRLEGGDHRGVAGLVVERRGDGRKAGRPVWEIGACAGGPSLGSGSRITPRRGGPPAGASAGSRWTFRARSGARWRWSRAPVLRGGGGCRARPRGRRRQCPSRAKSAVTVGQGRNRTGNFRNRVGWLRPLQLEQNAPGAAGLAVEQPCRRFYFGWAMMVWRT